MVGHMMCIWARVADELLRHSTPIIDGDWRWLYGGTKITVFVWIVSAMTVTKVVEGCGYIRRRYYGILPRVGGEFEHSALSPISLSRSVL